jgi:crotonobetainyl-CoA:carnitine CoA-transferase CaiB-like acyl-CoA transferase
MTMLEGIRIVDLSSVVFGPYATQMLADMGAEVIKVEPPTGDVSRYLGRSAKTPGNGSTHLTINRGKKSIMLDLKQVEDAATMRALLGTADVFIHNVRGKAIEKLGFGYSAVKEIKADIIYVHCTGFGQDGPYRDLQAYDDVIQAATGTCTLAPRVDGNPSPRYIPSLIADKVSGLYGAQAILAAIVHKLRTGGGQHVEVPMFEAFANFMLEEHLQDATLDPPIGRIGYARQLDRGRQPFPTADGYISIVPYSDAKIVLLFDLLGASAVLDDQTFSTPLARFRNGTLLYDEIAKLTPSKTTAEWVRLLTAAEFPVMPVRDIADIFDDPHLRATSFFRPRTHPTEGAYHEMRPPIRFSADPSRTVGYAPLLDADGPVLRAELGRN